MAFELHPAELQLGIEAVIEKSAADPTASYEPLAELVVEALGHGLETARDVVPTQMIVDGTLAILRQPSVHARMTPEVIDRTIVAKDCAREFAETAAQSRLLLAVFQHSRALGQMMTEDDVLALQHSARFTTLGRAAFGDACRMMGGAHRMLTRQEVAEPASDIIARSTELAAASGRIATERGLRAARTLGHPYTLPRFLATISGPTGAIEVILNEEGRRVVDAMSSPRGGCPAAFIPSPLGRGTVLTNAWEAMAPILVPENATTKARNVRPIAED